MRSSTAVTVLSLLLAPTGAGAAPAMVEKMLSGDEDDVLVATGAFGPAQTTHVVITYDMMGEGSFDGFAVVGDSTSPGGIRKFSLPRLPSGSMDGAMATALIANLDGDPALELVIELGVQRVVGNERDGGYSYGTYEYVVLDYAKGRFVRLARAERALAKAMTQRDEADAADPLDVRAIRAALKLPAP